MITTGNTILITGGGSGIGRGLAEAFHKLGNKVIIAGRRRAVLDEVVAANPGIEAVTLDVENSAAVEAFAARLVADYPALNMVVHNAGIMRAENVQNGPGAYLADAEAIVTTNLLGPIRLNAALLPHLLQQKHAAVLTMTSGLAFTPLASTPTYCATKAAIHVYTESLRYQLQGTPVEVLEVVPPYVQTELNGPDQAVDPRAMPLDEFIGEVISILTTQPDATEVLVERVKPLRFSLVEGKEKYDAFLQSFNDAFSRAHQAK